MGAHCDKYLPQPDPGAVALSALSVDAREQGRGLGTAAMRALPSFVPRHFPQARRVVLAVNQRNPAARRTYDRAGFALLGERQGPAGPQWVMTLPLLLSTP
ncbi:GNAT family N-acetyltransferase [Deinococcus arcticus]|uniref:GNAT family N-acetyltransferase n=1 Tax=Deinococcus arcticus TaxID=2136176 RepID=UPI001E292776|nr:GNAT family N-acetyltransferase [Deinococcus arcticus]